MTKTDIEGPFVMENTQRGVFSSKQRAYLWTGNVSSGYGDAIMSKIDESMTKSDTEGSFVMGNTHNFVISSHLMLFRNICLGIYGAMTVSSGRIPPPPGTHNQLKGHSSVVVVMGSFCRHDYHLHRLNIL